MNQSSDLLLIEDSPSQALHVQLLLERAGYRVHTAGDALQGYWQACTVVPRLILLDVDLPIMDGFQVLRYLKHHSVTKAIPVIMLSDRDRLHDVERAIELGAEGFLLKDDDGDDLCATVAEILMCSTLAIAR